MSLFVKGQQKIGGRRTGARHKISTALLEAFAADFAENGAETIKITRLERPTEYLKIAVSLLPTEFEITDNRLTEVSDDELDIIINEVRARIRGAFISDAGSGEGTATQH
jgi:hypothetical protein